MEGSLAGIGEGRRVYGVIKMADTRNLSLYGSILVVREGVLWSQRGSTCYLSNSHGAVSNYDFHAPKSMEVYRDTLSNTFRAEVSERFEYSLIKCLLRLS